jgi:hypothetical protein
MALVPKLALQMVKDSREDTVTERYHGRAARPGSRAYALIMKTLDTSLGYSLVWALDRLGWRIATQELVVREEFRSR